MVGKQPIGTIIKTNKHRKNLIPGLFFVALFACHAEKNVQIPEPAAQNENLAHLQRQQNEVAAESYDAFPAYVQFAVGEDGRSFDPEAQKQFLASGELPLETGFYDWAKKHSAAESLAIYNEFIRQNASHPWINVYRQYYGWLMLTRHKLLSTGNEETTNAVAQIVSNLVDARYEGYGLLYYALNYLKSHGAPVDLSALGKNIVYYHASLTQHRKAKMEAQKPDTHPSDDRNIRAQQRFEELLAKRNEHEAFVAKIQELTE